MRSFLLDALRKGKATIPPPSPETAALEEAARALGERARRRLGRSLAIREVDAGSCNGCELEIHAVNNPVYDIERFGLKFVASPRHADVLLVTGPVTWNMREALLRTYDATPEPKWVVALGDCACRPARARMPAATLGDRQGIAGFDAGPGLSCALRPRRVGPNHERSATSEAASFRFRHAHMGCAHRGRGTRRSRFGDG
jgi:NADH ubiquinone oxidoreductase subunit